MSPYTADCEAHANMIGTDVNRQPSSDSVSRTTDPSVLIRMVSKNAQSIPVDIEGTTIDISCSGAKGMFTVSYLTTTHAK
jgi:hypothetical protein